MLYVLVVLPLTIVVAASLLYLARDSRPGRLNWWMLITALVVLFTAILHVKTWLWPRMFPEHPPAATDIVHV